MFVFLHDYSHIGFAVGASQNIGIVPGGCRLFCKDIIMKRFVKYIYLTVFACSAILTFNSCLGSEDEVEGTPECAILSFAVGDIKSAVTMKNYRGEDTTYYRTISGSSIKFNIDQTRGLISTVDSLPNWLDITRVVPSFNSYGYVYVKLNDLYYSFTSGKDSLDFTNGLDLMVVSTDGASSRNYSVKINKSSIDADTLIWNKLPQNNLVLKGAHRLLAKDGKMLIFAEDGHNTTMTSSNDCMLWTVPAVLEYSLDPQSVTLFGNSLYALNSEGRIFKSGDGLTWNIASDKSAEQILASDANYLYVLSDGAVLSSSDLKEWKVNGEAGIAMLPKTNVCSQAYSSRTNPELQNVVLLGTAPAVAGNSVVWFKVSSKDENSNQKWNYIQITSDNPYPLPHADEISLAYTEGKLFAYIADYTHGTHSLYTSEDNGITWHGNEQNVLPPSDITTSAPSSFIIFDGNAWIVQGGEEPMVWRGTLRTVK